MKKEYLETICNKLNDKGFTEYRVDDILSSDRSPFSRTSGEIASFRWLPEENLKKIAEFDIGEYKDYRAVYQAWGRNGFLKFTPYVVTNNSGSPTLVLRHNRFMHMFRGYYFQISETASGIGECNRSSYRTSGLLELLRRNTDYADSHLLFILMYASMIDCGFQNDNFRYAFYDHTDIIDKFFAASMKSWGVNFPYDSSLLQQYISYSDGSLDDAAYPNTVYEVPIRDGIACRFSMLDDAVLVEYNPTLDDTLSRTVAFHIPSAVEGINIEQPYHWDADDIDDLNSDLVNAIHRDETVQMWILLMLLKMVGIHTCFISTYPIKKIGKIPKAAYKLCKEFKDLNWK